MNPQLAMELREVDVTDRLISGVVVPYDEVSYLVPDPAGERVCRGAFTKSIEQAGRKIPLFVGHGRAREAAVGLAESWTDDRLGLCGVFKVKTGPDGDQALDDARGGYYGGLSVEFAPISRARAADGVAEVRQARLLGVALVGVAAYDGSRILAVREAAAPAVPPRPEVDLTPIPAFWLSNV